MKSLFNKADSEEIISRINSLTPTARPQWGKMNAAQMLAHCTAPLKMAHGEIKSKRRLVSFLFGKMAKKKFANPAIPFDRNLPTDPNFKFPDAADFEAEKKKLIAQIRTFNEKGAAAIGTEPHSFFGTMTPQEWDIIQTKHLDHHLTQFGA
ncbi:MAG: DUF1569 domain-containing protein [Bacteroidia bacterium]